MDNRPKLGGIAVDKNLQDLVARTRYPLVQENGQRKYGGPPPDWEGGPPPKGSEVFVGKIPRDCFEDELVPVFERVGKIYEMRLMMDFSGSNRGYGFVMYTCPEDVQKATRTLNGYEIRPNRNLGVVKSVDNCRLFVGGIPKNKTREEVLEEMTRMAEGVVDVLLYASVTDKTRSRGFAFVEFESHRAAAMARRKFSPGKMVLWGHELAVDWAEPEPEVDPETMAKVKALYVRNLMVTTTENQLRDIFNELSGDGVEKVKKLRDFAFIHFATREQAESALEATETGLEIDGISVEVMWSKPVDRNAYRLTKALSKNHHPHGMFGSVSPPPPSMQALPAHYDPMIPNATGSALVQAGHFTRGNGGKGRGAAGFRAGRGTTIPLPLLAKNPLFRRGHIELRQWYDLQPGMDLIPTNPYTLRPYKPPQQVLEELCAKNNLGSPVYTLLQTKAVPDDKGEPLYLYKITIPGIDHPYNNLQPNKLVKNPEEAKDVAAEHALSQLGCPVEGCMVPVPVCLPPPPPMQAGGLIMRSPMPQMASQFVTAMPPAGNSNILAHTTPTTYLFQANPASSKMTPYENHYYDGIPAMVPPIY